MAIVDAGIDGYFNVRCGTEERHGPEARPRVASMFIPTRAEPGIVGSTIGGAPVGIGAGFDPMGQEMVPPVHNLPASPSHPAFMVQA